MCHGADEVQSVDRRRFLLNGEGFSSNRKGTGDVTSAIGRYRKHHRPAASARRRTRQHRPRRGWTHYPRAARTGCDGNGSRSPLRQERLATGAQRVMAA